MSALTGRVVSALVRGGAVRRAGGSHAVYRRADARRSPMARLASDTVAKLADRGFLVPDGDWLVWSGAPVPDGLVQEGMSGRAQGQKTATAAPAAGLLALALDTGNSTDRLRMAEAARRYMTDAEAACRGQTITMNWDLVPRGRSGAPGRGPAGFAPGAAEAGRRLSLVSRHVGQHDLALIDGALCLGWSAREAAARTGRAGRDEIVQALRDALDRLARVYDLYVSPVSAA